MTKEYDLLVIGGGSGGLAHAQRAAEYGAQAAVIEYGPLGGTCVNVGCVPKKVMWYAAEMRHHLDHAADYGFGIHVHGHDWDSLKARRDAYVTRLNGIYESNLDRRGVAERNDRRRRVTVAQDQGEERGHVRVGARGAEVPVRGVRNDCGILG